MGQDSDEFAVFADRDTEMWVFPHQLVGIIYKCSGREGKGFTITPFSEGFTLSPRPPVFRCHILEYNATPPLPRAIANRLFASVTVSLPRSLIGVFSMISRPDAF